MPSISLRNNGISPELKNKTSLTRNLSEIFEKENTAFKQVTYIFCTDEYLLKINQQYLQHDTYTDIITFNLAGLNLPVVSEVYISVERVKENAKTLQVPYCDEIHRVMIHGILHLCGYSDHTKELKEEMRVKENYYLSRRPSDILF
jgi:probable rRNA maturation factor